MPFIKGKNILAHFVHISLVPHPFATGQIDLTVFEAYIDDSVKDSEGRCNISPIELNTETQLVVLIGTFYASAISKARLQRLLRCHILGGLKSVTYTVVYSVQPIHFFYEN